MPTLEENRRNLEEGIRSGRLVPAPPPLETALPVPLPVSFPPSPNPALRTPMPKTTVLEPDTVRQFFNPATPQTRVPPLPPASNPNIGAQAASQSITVIKSGQGTLLQTNGVDNARQSALNLIAGDNIALVSNAVGGVTVTGQGGDLLSRPSRKHFVVWVPGIASATAVNIFSLFDTVTITSGGEANVGTLESHFDRNRTWQLGSNPLNVLVGQTHRGLNLFFSARSITFVTRVKETGSLTSVRHWLGLTNSDTPPWRADTDTPLGAFLGFRFSPALSPTWEGVVSGGNKSFTRVSGGPAPDSYHTLAAVWDAAAGTVSFSSDGVVFGSANTDLPTTSFSDLALIDQLLNTAAVAALAQVDYMYAEQPQLGDPLAANAAMPVVSVSDDFNRANGGLGANWFTAAELPAGSNTNPQISGNAVVSSALNAVSYSAWKTTNFPPDQFAEVKIVALAAATAFILPSVRFKTTNQDFSAYQIALFGPAGSAVSATIRKVIGNVITTLTTFSITPVIGDIIRLEIVGSSLTAKQNGVVRATATDTVLTAGQPGFQVFFSAGVAGDSKLDDFKAGSL